MAPTENSEPGDSETSDDAVPSTPSATVAEPSAEPDADDGTSGALIIAALLLGISLLMSAYAVSSSLDNSGLLIAGTLAKTNTALRQAVYRATPAPIVQPELDPNSHSRSDKKLVAKTAGSPAQGPESAKVTVVEFSDFQCPFCARVTPTLRKIRKTYGDDVRIVWKHLPLPIHPQATAAHRAGEAAHRQGKFWQLHDKIFGQQAELSEQKYLEWAAEIGLDMETFKRDLADPELTRKIDADVAEADALGLRSTPSFLVNGQLLVGAQPFSAFEKLIDQELAAQSALNALNALNKLNKLNKLND